MSYEDYNDLCTECKSHDKCHKNEIDYDKIIMCKRQLTCPFGIPQKECCEDDVCQQCRYRLVNEEDIYCAWYEIESETKEKVIFI